MLCMIPSGHGTGETIFQSIAKGKDRLRLELLRSVPDFLYLSGCVANLEH